MTRRQSWVEALADRAVTNGVTNQPRPVLRQDAISKSVTRCATKAHNFTLQPLFTILPHVSKRNMTLPNNFSTQDSKGSIHKHVNRMAILFCLIAAIAPTIVAILFCIIATISPLRTEQVPPETPGILASISALPLDNGELPAHVLSQWQFQ